MKKKLLIALLATAAVSGCALGFTACGLFGSDNDAPNNTDETYYYELNADKQSYSVINVKPEAASAEMVVPDTFKDKPVTGIKGFHIDGLTGVRVTLPDSITALGGGAFVGCHGLTSINIPDSVTSIGDNAFGDTCLTSIAIPDSVTSLGEGVFSQCSDLTSATLGNGISYIPGGTFLNCPNLTTVTLPDRVTSIGMSAFGWCSKLTSITIPEGVTEISRCAFEQCVGLTGELIIPDSVTFIGDNAFINCRGLTSITIPDSVTTIEEQAFFECRGIESVQLPAEACKSFNFREMQSLEESAALKSVTITSGNEIYEYAFYGCAKLTDLTLPDSITAIGDFAFNFCGGLTGELTLPANLTTIGESAFEGCSGLTGVTIGNKVTAISDRAFNWCSGLTDLTIGNKVTTIGESAFCGCEELAGELIIPDSVTAIGRSAFNGCRGLTGISMGNGVTTIGEYAFSGCIGVTDLTISAGVTKIGSYAFEGYEALQNVTMPTYAINYINKTNLKTVVLSGGNSIDSRAFEDCGELTSVTIPAGLKSIGSYAFSDCNGLTRVNISDLKSWCDIIFSGAFANPLYYAHNLYIDDQPITELEIPATVASIGSYAFYNCNGLTSVTIPDSVKSIGDSAFNWCSGLTRVNAADINSWCGISFNNNSSNPLYCANNLYVNGQLVTNLVIPSTVTTIKGYAFYNCSGLTGVTVHAGVTAIGTNAFYGCSGLTRVNITNLKNWCGISFDTTSSNPLYYARKLYIDNQLVTALEIPSTVTAIGGSAFYNCSSLTSVTIPDSVKTIGHNAFYSCSGLTKVNITDLKNWCGISFGDYANPLYYAHNLYIDNQLVTELEIPASVTAIGASAFNGCTGLTSIVIPIGVTKIGEGAFNGCSGLNKVYYRGTASATWGAISVGNNNYELTNATLYYYSATQPAGEGNYWHYDTDDNIVVW